MSTLEVARSVVKVSRQHHPQGKTFLVRDYTKNGQTRQFNLERAVVEIVPGHVVMHRLGQADLCTTARYVHVLDETGESAARRFEGPAANAVTVGRDWPEGGFRQVYVPSAPLSAHRGSGHAAA